MNITKIRISDTKRNNSLNTGFMTIVSTKPQMIFNKGINGMAFKANTSDDLERHANHALESRKNEIIEKLGEYWSFREKDEVKNCIHKGNVDFAEQMNKMIENSQYRIPIGSAEIKYILQAENPEDMQARLGVCKCNHENISSACTDYAPGLPLRSRYYAMVTKSNAACIRKLIENSSYYVDDIAKAIFKSDAHRELAEILLDSEILKQYKEEYNYQYCKKIRLSINADVHTEQDAIAKIDFCNTFIKNLKEENIDNFINILFEVNTKNLDFMKQLYSDNTIPKEHVSKIVCGIKKETDLERFNKYYTDPTFDNSNLYLITWEEFANDRDGVVSFYEKLKEKQLSKEVIKTLIRGVDKSNRQTVLELTSDPDFSKRNLEPLIKENAFGIYYTLFKEGTSSKTIDKIIETVSWYTKDFIKSLLQNDKKKISRTVIPTIVKDARKTLR